MICPQHKTESLSHASAGDACDRKMGPVQLRARTWRRSPLARIAMLVVGVVLIVLGSTSVALAYAPKTNQNSTSQKETKIDTKNTKKDTKSTKNDKKDSSKTTSASKEKCLDDHNNLTAYAISELTGAELVQTVESLSYKYDAKEGAYVSTKGNEFAAIDKNLKSLDAKAIKKLKKGGGSAEITYARIVTGYKNVRDAFTGTSKCVVDDVVVLEDTHLVAVVRGPSMKEYMMIGGPKKDKENTYVFSMFSDEAIAAGLFDKTANFDSSGTQKYGSSIDEVWKNLTGCAVGDYVQEHPFK